MTSFYPQGASHILGKTSQIDFVTDTFKVILYAGSYNSSHEYVSNLTGASIVARSASLTGVTVSNGLVFANNVSFPSLTGSSFSVVILYKDTGSDATSPLVAEFDIPTFTPAGATVNMVWNPSGIFTLL